MNRSVRTTVVFSLVGGLLSLLLLWGLDRHGFYPAPAYLVLWGLLGTYAVLLARWSHTRLTAILFPLILLLALALIPVSFKSFIVLSLAMLSWIRSGICFQGSPLRSLAAELVSVGGGLVMVLFLAGPSMLSWALGLTLFGLMQALYFFVAPMGPQDPPENRQRDSFEHALQEAEKILGTH